MKAKTRSYYVKKLDAVFSKHIRTSEAVDGIGTCVTCGVSRPWLQMQNGHFFSRSRYGTRWDEVNCHTQCVACNMFLKGNYINYTRYMIDRYGREAVDELEIKSKTPIKIPTNDIKDRITELSQK